MPSELVPTSYAREAYNVLYGTELRAHSDALTAKQAERINNQYDIELHVGTHGLGYDPNNPISLLQLPTQQEYQAVADVIDGMRPGDTLFLEDYGFNIPGEKAADQPTTTPQVTEKQSTGPLLRGPDNHKTVLHSVVLEYGRDQLEQARRKYTVGVGDYARGLALLKGINVVRADEDAFGEKSIQEASGGKSLMELILSHDEKDMGLKERIKTRRELSARNIVKDWALEHLPPEGASVPTDRKPKLVPLFGEIHKEGLKRAFNDIGLDVKVITMGSSDWAERSAEKIDLLVQMLGNLGFTALGKMGYSNEAMPESPQSEQPPNGNKKID